MLLSKWWSAMRDSGLSGSDETDPGHDTLDQLGMQALSTAIAGSGGIGLGAIMVRDLLSNAQEQTRGQGNDCNPRHQGRFTQRLCAKVNPRCSKTYQELSAMADCHLEC